MCYFRPAAGQTNGRDIRPGERPSPRSCVISFWVLIGRFPPHIPCDRPPLSQIAQGAAIIPSRASTSPTPSYCTWSTRPTRRLRRIYSKVPCSTRLMAVGSLTISTSARHWNPRARRVRRQLRYKAAAIPKQIRVWPPAPSSASSSWCSFVASSWSCCSRSCEGPRRRPGRTIRPTAKGAKNGNRFPRTSNSLETGLTINTPRWERMTRRPSTRTTCPTRARSTF